ncbi:unnamed protein product [Orchesella dallaii]|uniref:Uncharacterized protein n=1 Tax=Orchesella dallaii TaxID=48710 RepID=A0ABP1R3P6_9HEXA
MRTEGLSDISNLPTEVGKSRGKGVKRMIRKQPKPKIKHEYICSPCLQKYLQTVGTVCEHKFTTAQLTKLISGYSALCYTVLSCQPTAVPSTPEILDEILDRAAENMQENSSYNQVSF